MKRHVKRVVRVVQNALVRFPVAANRQLQPLVRAQIQRPIKVSRFHRREPTSHVFRLPRQPCESILRQRRRRVARPPHDDVVQRVKRRRERLRRHLPEIEHHVPSHLGRSNRRFLASRHDPRQHPSRPVEVLHLSPRLVHLARQKRRQEIIHQIRPRRSSRARARASPARARGRRARSSRRRFARRERAAHRVASRSRRSSFDGVTE